MRNAVLSIAVIVAVSLGFVWSYTAEAGWCNGRSSASLAALNIKWETVDGVSVKKPTAVVTGEDSDEATAEETGPKLRWTDRPVLVYVCDETVACEGFDKLEEVVLKDEKVALAMKAFRTVKMHPDQVEEDPLLADNGKEVPRMLLVDPTKLKVTVLEKGKLKASGLYKAMGKVAGRVFKEKLDKVVKAHLKMLTEQDQLANAEKVLVQKAERLSEEEGRKAEKDLEEIKAERAELQAELKELNAQMSKLWKLTPKATA